MPTPFEPPAGRRRSIFGNYSTGTGCVDAPEETEEGAGAPPIEGTGGRGGSRQEHLQPVLDQLLARVFVHAFLARALEDPTSAGWEWLTSEEVKRSMTSAVAVIEEIPGGRLTLPFLALRERWDAGGYDAMAAAHLTAFGHTVRGDCPMNEIEYGDIKADPLFQPHRLADLGAFFAAFGLELVPDAGERLDHISIELEFMSFLAAREAHAREHQYDEADVAVLVDAQRKFLREHLGRWTPAFARRLARRAASTLLEPLAGFLGEFIRLECARFGVPPGSEDLLLRPVDDAAERLCDSCALRSVPPGAGAGANEGPDPS